MDEKMHFAPKESCREISEKDKILGETKEKLKDISRLEKHVLFGKLDIPSFYYFKQDDPRWWDFDYLGWKLSETWCWPTAMAIVASFMLNKEISPVLFAEYAIQKWYRKVWCWTDWAFMDIACTAVWLTSERISSKNNLIKSLKAGKPIIWNMKKWKFTRWNWHFVVISGYNDTQNKVTVYDPKTWRNEGVYDLALITSQSKQFWAYNYIS